jgi:hypothetical protein
MTYFGKRENTATRGAEWISCWNHVEATIRATLVNQKNLVATTWFGGVQQTPAMILELDSLTKEMRALK